MKKVFFSMAGIALVAGSALAFSTAKVDNPVDCNTLPENHRCTISTTNVQEACCFKIIEGTPQYYRLPEE